MNSHAEENVLSAFETLIFANLLKKSSKSHINQEISTLFKLANGADIKTKIRFANIIKNIAIADLFREFSTGEISQIKADLSACVIGALSNDEYFAPAIKELDNLIVMKNS